MNENTLFVPMRYAARLYRLPLMTLQTWVTKGKVTTKIGKPAFGSKKSREQDQTLVDLADVERCLSVAKPKIWNRRDGILARLKKELKKGDRAMSAKAASLLLKVCPKELRAKCRAGLLPYNLIGKNRRIYQIRLSDLIEYVKSYCEKKPTMIK